MADFKTYNVVYNITATAGEAEKVLQNLANSAERLGKGNHMRRFNSQIRELANYSQRMTEAMNSFSPRVDMRTFKAQLQLMEKAVAISAQNMRGMIQMALNGTNEQFERAMKGKGSWASVLREGLLKEEKEVKKQLTNTTKEIDRISKLIANANNGTKGVVTGRSAANLLTDKEKDLYKKQLSVLKAQEKSLTNSIGSITDKLNVLGRTAPSTIKTSVNAIGNIADNADKLNQMAKAINKYNKATANMPKNQTYKITFNAKDNTSGAIKKIREQIALLKAEAATIFMGGAPSNATKRTSNKRPKGVLSSVELKNQESLLNTLKQLSAAKANGIWSREMTAIAGQVLPAVAQALGMPVETPMNNLLREYNKKYNEEVKKYQDWRNSNAKPKTTATPKKASAPVRTTVPLGIQNPSMWTGRVYQIPTAPINYGSAFNGGNVAFGASMTGHRVQELVNGRPIFYRGAFNGGDVAFGANQTLYRTQGLVDERPIQVRGRFNQAGIRFGAGRAVVGLNQLADQHRVKVKGTFDQSGLRFSFGRALVELQNIANARPINIRGNFVGGTIPSSGVGAARTTSTPKPGVYPSGNGGSTPPPSMPGVVPSGTRRNPVNVRNIYDGGVFNATKRWLYPLTGNTSFGARTPAVVEMAKGMGMMMAVGGAMGAVGNSFSQSVDYQNMMTTTRAILGRSYKGNDFEGDISAMEKIVRNEGILTKFTAPEVAGAAKYLAMAGMDIPTINAAIKPVTNIALAGDIDLPTAADKMTNIMTAFQMRTPRDFIRASDVLTNTFTKSNTNMLQLAEAAQYAAPIAAARGMKLEDMMALVGVMSDAGIQSSMAGTTLRMMMNNIYKPSKGQEKTWAKLAKLGVTRTDKNGNWLNVIDILDQIAQKVPVNGKANESLADIMGNLFRVTSAAGATQLAKNIAKVKALRDSNYNSYGAAESIRDARINNVRGKLAQVSSQFTEDMLKIFEKPENQQRIMDMLDKFRETLAKPETIKVLEGVFDMLLNMANFVGKMAEIGAKVIGKFPNFVSMMLQFQFAMTMVGSYIITPIQQLVNTIGTLIPGLGKGGIAKGGLAAASGAILSGAANVGKTSGYNAARVQALTTMFASGGPVSPAPVNAAFYNSKQVRLESLRNRLNYKAPFSSNPHDEFMAALRADRYAQEAAKDAANWRNAAKYGYGYESALIATMAMGRYPGVRAQAQARSGLERYVAQQQRRKRNFANRDVMARAARIYNPATNYNNYRNAGTGRWNSFWKATGRSLNFAGKGASAALTAGMAAGTFKNVFGSGMQSARSGLMSAIMSLTKGFGMLLSPVGMATIALGGLVGGIIAYKNKLNNDREKNRERRNTEKPLTEQLQQQREKWESIGTEHINSGLLNSTKRSLGGKNDPQIRHAAGFSAIFDINNREFDKGTYFQDRYNTYIKPYAKYIYGDDIGYQGFKNMFNLDAYGSMTGVSPEIIRKQFEQGAIYRIAESSSSYKNARSKALELLFNWSKLPSAQRNSSYNELMENLLKIRDSFDIDNALDISGRNFGTLRYSDISNSKQANLARRQFIDSLIGGKDLDSARLFAKFNLSNATPYSNNWFEAFDTTLNNVKLDELRGATLQFKNGTANWEKFYTDLRKLNIDFENTTQGHLKVLSTIAEHISNDPNLKELESVRKYLEGLIKYINEFDAKEMLSRYRSEMQEWAAPIHLPITVTTGQGNAPEHIRKPGKTTLNFSPWQDAYNTKLNNISKIKAGVDQTPFKPSNYSGGPLSSNSFNPTNNTVNIHIDSVMGADRDSAQLFSDIVGKELVNALGIINEQYQGGVS